MLRRHYQLARHYVGLALFIVAVLGLIGHVALVGLNLNPLTAGGLIAVAVLGARIAGEDA